MTNDSAEQTAEQAESPTPRDERLLMWWEEHGLVPETRAEVRAWQDKTGRKTMTPSDYPAFRWECLFSDHARCFGLRSGVILMALNVQDYLIDLNTGRSSRDLAFHLTDMLGGKADRLAQELWEQMTCAGWWAGPYSTGDGIRLSVPAICPVHGGLL